jgi:hypothetical protein
MADDVLPSSGGNLLGRFGFAPSAWFTGTLNIRGTTRINPLTNLGTPILSLVGFWRPEGRLNRHGQRAPND